MFIEIIKAVYNRQTGELKVVLSDGARKVVVSNAENCDRDVLLRDFYKLAHWQTTNVSRL
jgi:hypothetical protein